MTSGQRRGPRQVGLVAPLVGVCLLSSACSGSSIEQLETAADDGATCQELFDVRNNWESDDPDMEEANEVLRSIGCTHSAATRTDQ